MSGCVRVLRVRFICFAGRSLSSCSLIIRFPLDFAEFAVEEREGTTRGVMRGPEGGPGLAGAFAMVATRAPTSAQRYSRSVQCSHL